MNALLVAVAFGVWTLIAVLFGYVMAVSAAERAANDDFETHD